MGLITISPHKITPKKLAAIGIVSAEIIGFGFYREPTADFHKAILEGAGNFGLWLLDAPAENALCTLTSALPSVTFNSDCVQNWWDDKIRGGNESEEAQIPGGTPVPTVPNETPNVTVITNPPALPEYQYNLVADMEQRGYTCTDEQVVYASSGDGAIDLLVEGGTNRGLANTAYENGAVSGLNIKVGEAALTGACS